MLHPLPSVFPEEAIGLVLGFVRGSGTTWQQALRGAWEVIGYAQTFVPANGPAAAGASCPEMTADQCAKALELATALEAHAGVAAESSRVKGAEAMLWPVILPLLFDLAQKVLLEWLKK